MSGLSQKADAPFPALDAKRFAFRWDVEGRPPSLGFSFVVREDRSATLVQSPGEKPEASFTRVDFELTEAEYEALRTMLQEVGFTGLAAHFSPKDTVYDGSWWDMYVRIDGRLKHVSCSNAFPEEIRWVAANVIRKLLVPYESSFIRGRPIKVPEWTSQDCIPD